MSQALVRRTSLNEKHVNSHKENNFQDNRLKKISKQVEQK